MWLLPRGDSGDGVTIFGIKTVGKIEDLAGLENGLADIVKIVRKSFQFGEVFRDRHITLQEVAELDFVEDHALELIVEEFLLDDGPKGEGVDLALAHDLKNLRGARGVDPVDNALVHLVLVGVTIGDDNGGGDVAAVAKLAERQLKEHLPFGEIGVGKFEGD
jgi:hypothetical protein